MLKLKFMQKVPGKCQKASCPEMLFAGALDLG